MRKLLWAPNEDFIQSPNIRHFMNYAQEKTGKLFSDYHALYKWSIEFPEEFWGCCWDFFGIICSNRYGNVVDDYKKMPGAVWFSGSKMNYAENLLRFCKSNDEAIIFRGENGLRKAISHRELFAQVSALASAMRKFGIKKGDTVVGYMPNIPQTVIAMLATSAIGGIWCSCATDIGPQAAADRLGQVKPKLMFTVDEYIYKGKTFSVIEKAETAATLMNVDNVVVASFLNESKPIAEGMISWNEYIQSGESNDFYYEQMDSTDPLLIMFSSGTTGKPKCIMHAGTGLLVNQLKELILQNDVRPKDRVMYITTCSWMMWNWQLAALATGAALVLYDGHPSYPDYSAIWKVVEEEKITLFGVSASYIHTLMNSDFSPKSIFDLSSLRCISQTGSALSEDGFEYVYRAIKEDFHFSSISGGTDINGSFASGNPISPVLSGELQMPALGMAIDCFDEHGNSIRDSAGELVCTKSIPTMPISLYNDTGNEQYLFTYFSMFPGVWRQGDYVLFHSDTGGISFYGRSDAVLKPSGVRIGTAEIYNIVNKIEGVKESIAVGQHYGHDQRVILFVEMKNGKMLTEKIENDIRAALRIKASPRHVPAVILQCPDYPRTLNGKKVEIVVKNIINGIEVGNVDSIENPKALEYFYSIKRKLES